ncbi:MAG: 4Fe-4S dicluster domain-containing protein [Magnetococcales bacterium]|nr:4Fe-4S dicluster domain-containing protein [Magnetococcales bacterium]
MTASVAGEAAILDWIRTLGSRGPVFFPQKIGRQSLGFQPVRRESVLEFAGYHPTLAPPGKRLAPAVEVLFQYRSTPDRGLEFSPPPQPPGQILAGVRSCDLKAIHLMDRVNGAAPGDPLYLARRAGTTLLAVDCLQPCDTACFCAAVGSLGWRQGADLFLTPLEEAHYLMEALTPAGATLLAEAGFDPCPDPETHRRRAEARRANPFGRHWPVPVTELPTLLDHQWQSPVWSRHVERCFSCGTCNLVCPTCYCFDVRDDFDLAAPQEGQRQRSPDGCMLPGFAAVAGGHDFRPQPEGRQRHRVRRKFQYLGARHGGDSFCIGCGRCGRQCTAGIDIFAIVTDLIQHREMAP